MGCCDRVPYEYEPPTLEIPQWAAMDRVSVDSPTGLTDVVRRDPRRLGRDRPVDSW